MRHEPLSQRVLGRWPGILTALGVSSKALRNKHGPCPMCGGKDRFRFDNKGGRGTWICSQCGAGDGVDLVKRLLNADFKEAARAIEQHLGSAPVSFAGSRPRPSEQIRKEMIGLWKRSRSIELDDPAGKYLHKRLGLTTFPPCLRFAPDERYTEAGSRPSWHPMIVALVEPSDAAKASGDKSALHRTYLDQFGGKADVSAPRKMMGAMPTGAAVRLAPIPGDKLGIAEGIETALAASILFNMPVWAALTAALLQEWAPPPAVSTVFIFGDNDASATGQAAAYGLAQRLKAKNVSAFVELPARTGSDWADVLFEQLAADGVR